MALISLLTASDAQQLMAEALRARRKQRKLSRRALAEISTVPEATIKKFETCFQISFRQFLLLWQSLGNLQDLADLARQMEQDSLVRHPQTISDVLKDERE